MNVRSIIVEALAPELKEEATRLQNNNLSLRGTIRKRHKQHQSRIGTIKHLNDTILRMTERIAELEGNPIPTMLDVKAAAKNVDPIKVQKYRDYINEQRQKGIINALRELISEEEFLGICAKFNAMSDENLDGGWGLKK